MTKKNNTIFWIIGIIIFLLIVGPQLGLFSTQSCEEGALYDNHCLHKMISNRCKQIYPPIRDAGPTDDIVYVGACKVIGGINDGNFGETVCIMGDKVGICNFNNQYTGKIVERRPIFKSEINHLSCLATDGNGDGDGNGDYPLNGDGYPTNGNEDENGEVPSFSLNQVLFKIGNFGVTILHLIIFIIALFIIKMMFSKK